MRKVALRIDGEGDNVVAYRGRAFLFTDANDEEDQRTAVEAVRFLNLEEHLDLDDADAHSLQDAVKEHKPEVLTGYVDGDQLVMTSQSDYRHGRGSRLLRSLLREMGLSGARMDDYGETSEEIPVGEVTGSLPDTLLHGTTSEHMLGILRKGLTADETRSNYELGRTSEGAIRHPDTVFLTESPGKAEYHAVNAVHQLGVRRSPGQRVEYGSPRAKAGFPVIVEFSVPDKAKLVPDYDVDMWSDVGEGSFEQTENQRQKRRETGRDPRTQEDPFKLSRKFGIFGYRGRIPASFIRSIMIFTGEEESEGFQPGNWTTVTREQLERAIEYGEAQAWAYEDTCPECGELEGDCSCERCEDCGDKEWECTCEGAMVAASPYWRAFVIVANRHHYAGPRPSKSSDL